MSTTGPPLDQILQPLLTHYGKLLIGLVLGVTTLSILYGIFVFLFVLLCIELGPRKFSSPAHLRMFLASATGFLLATALEGTCIVIFGGLIHSAFIGPQGISFGDRSTLVSKLMVRLGTIALWIAYVQFIIGDIVVVWRAYILLQCMRWLIVVPLTFLLGAIIFILASLTQLPRGGDMEVYGYLGKAGIALSLGMNTVATILIGVVYWVHRKHMIAGLPGEHQPTQVERVLAIFVETGVFYCLIQAGFFAISMRPPTTLVGTRAAEIFSALYIGLTAMQPTLVVFLINRQRTLDHMYQMDSSPSWCGICERCHDFTTRRFPCRVESAVVPPAGLRSVDGV